MFLYQFIRVLQKFTYDFQWKHTLRKVRQPPNLEPPPRAEKLSASESQKRQIVPPLKIFGEIFGNFEPKNVIFLTVKNRI